MLLHAHSYLTPRGYLYIVLPLPCLTNSRYLSHERLTAILGSTGWDVVRKHDSARLTYWLVRRSETGPDGVEWKREQVRTGAGRNNFCLVRRVRSLPFLARSRSTADSLSSLAAGRQARLAHRARRPLHRSLERQERQGR